MNTGNIDNFVFLDASNTSGESSVYYLPNGSGSFVLSVIPDAGASVDISVMCKTDYQLDEWFPISVISKSDFSKVDTIDAAGIYVAPMDGIAQCKVVNNGVAGTVKVFGILRDTVTTPKAPDGSSSTHLHNDLQGRDAPAAHPISSIDGLVERLNAIEDVIPADASASNQLADKAFVASHYLPSQPKNLKGLAHIVQTGYADTLEIGTQFTIPWRDVAAGRDYDVPVDIVSVQDVEDEDGKTHRAAIIQWHYTTPFAIQFDAKEGIAATETNAEDGLYYYGKTGSNYTLLSLSAGDPIPYSDYDSVVKNSIKDTTCAIFTYGYSRYRDSAWRQFLTSESGVGEWWAATHVGDNAPSQLNSRAGFLSGFSAEDLALMKPCKITCYTNSVTDGSVIDTMYDRWWLASGTEMYGSVNANEGTYFPYWKEATGLTSPSIGANTGRIAYSLADHSSAQWHWLRSAYRGDSYHPWHVFFGGSLDYYYASSDHSALPCCAIY